MANPLMGTLTLREKLREAERLSRELGEHLEHGSLPKVQEALELARRAANPRLSESVSDNALRTHVDAVLSSHEYSLSVLRRLSDYLVAIEQHVAGLISGESTSP